MSQEYHTNLSCHDFDTINEYFRERIRRGLRRGYNYFTLQYHLQNQFAAVYHQYVQDLSRLASQDQEEEEEIDEPLR